MSDFRSVEGEAVELAVFSFRFRPRLYQTLLAQWCLMHRENLLIPERDYYDQTQISMACKTVRGPLIF
jgi:hypothetical protein